eukprot:15444340-Alexandrium_andersonii.AAC.1
MSASLVGSEMCIRDSPKGARRARGSRPKVARRSPEGCPKVARRSPEGRPKDAGRSPDCLLYTSPSPRD